MNDPLQNELRRLINQPISDCFVIGPDLLCVGLGPLRSFQHDEEGAIEVSQWYLHVHCGWRLRSAEQLMLGSYDIDSVLMSDAQILLSALVAQRPVITEFTVGEFGSISLKTDLGYTLDLFANSADDELWRLVYEHYQFVVTAELCSYTLDPVPNVEEEEGGA